MLEQGAFDIDELASLLDGLSDDEWVVEVVLSDNDFEKTQIVHRKDDPEGGRFVRKVFAGDSGLGSAYAKLHAAQSAGRRFAHLPHVYEVVNAGDAVSVVMEHVAGKTLQQVVEAQGPSVALAVHVGLELCDAMTELHEGLGEPLIHRDLKPSNIMLDGTRLVVIDLGIARAWRSGAERDTIRLGTPGYAPPEQFGYGQTTPQSDLYAAGMVMAYCLMGEEPTASLREMGFRGPGVPDPLRAVLMKATEIDAAARYATARDMRHAIEAASVQMGAVAGTGAADPARVVGPSTSNGSDATAPDAFSQRDRGMGTTDAAVSSGTLYASLQVNSPETSAHSASSYAAGGVKGDAVPPSSPAIGSTQRTSPRGFTVPDFVGRVWNGLLIAGWLALTVLSLWAALFSPSERLSYLPMWFRLLEYFTVIIIPSGLLCYAVSDRRRLRARVPFFARFAWKKELLVCLAVNALLFVVTTFIYWACSFG